MMKIYILIIALSFSHHSYNQKQDGHSLDQHVSVIYLGHSGWAVMVNNNFLVFDYQKKYDFNWKEKPEKILLNGYINPNEIKDFNVCVFVSHEHSDHYDPEILQWENEIKNITYFFGWDYSFDEKYNCLKNLRSTYVDESIEVHTINSAHSGVYESAFLVKIDGLTIYHNGDYKGDYENDFAYLKTKTNHIDLAFSNSVPIESTQYFQQIVFLIKDFNVNYFFPMHNINKENGYKKLAKMLYDRRLGSKVHCAEKPGDRFVL